MYKKRLGRKRGTRRPRKSMRRPMRKPKAGNTARLVETVHDYITTNTGYVATFRLQDFQRAQEVAHAYKYYRCAKVEADFIPFSNVAQAGGATARLPQLYKTVDRVANMNILPDENEMMERGIKPKIFTKQSKLVFKPNLLQHVQLEAYQNGEPPAGDPTGIIQLSSINSIPVFNKWLPTQQSFGYGPTAGSPNRAQTLWTVTQPAVNPYALRYYGLAAVVNVDGLGTEDNYQCGEVQIRIHWEFKGARALSTAAPSAFPDVYYQTSSQNPGVVPNTQPTEYCGTGPTGPTGP